MSEIDGSSVPLLVDSKTCRFKESDVYGYAMRLEKLYSLNEDMDPTGIWGPVYAWYAGPLQFAGRLLYLVALMHMAGIVHGMILSILFLQVLT